MTEITITIKAHCYNAIYRWEDTKEKISQHHIFLCMVIFIASSVWYIEINGNIILNYEPIIKND